MRASALLTAAVLLLASALPVALAQDDGHDHEGEVALQDLEVASRQRVKRLWAQVVCSCPRENWSKSLLNCPDGCADGQKQQILQQVTAGWEDERILDAQEAQFGPLVIGTPDDAMTYVLPFAMLAAAALVVLIVLMRWTRAARERAEEPPPPSMGDAELAAVERELEELD